MLSNNPRNLSNIFGDSSVWGAVLFGSVARGETDSVSDVDIMVFSDTLLTYDEYMTLYRKLTTLLDRNVDLIDFSIAKGPLLSSVRKNHIVVYGNKNRIEQKLNEADTDELVYIKEKEDITKSKI